MPPEVDRCQRYWRGDPAIFFLQGGSTEPRNTRPRHPRECQFATFAKKEATPSRGLAPSPAANPMERLRLIDMSKPLHKGSPKERALRKKVKRCGTSELLTYLNLDGNWDIRLFALARLAKMKVDFKDNTVAFTVSRILFSMRNLSDSGNKFPHRDDIFFGRSFYTPPLRDAGQGALLRDTSRELGFLVCEPCVIANRVMITGQGCANPSDRHMLLERHVDRDLNRRLPEFPP